jgi:hypothetical protein
LSNNICTINTPISEPTGSGTIWSIFALNTAATTVTSCPTTSGHAWTLQAKHESSNSTTVICTLVPVAGDTNQGAVVTFVGTGAEFCGLTPFVETYRRNNIQVDTAAASSSSAATSFAPTAITTSGSNETVAVGIGQLAGGCSIAAITDPSMFAQSWAVGSGANAVNGLTLQAEAGTVPTQTFSSNQNCGWGGL